LNKSKVLKPVAVSRWMCPYCKKLFTKFLFCKNHIAEEHVPNAPVIYKISKEELEDLEEKWHGTNLGGN
jgi:hypothetical protein